MDLDEALRSYLEDSPFSRSLSETTRQSWKKFAAFCHSQGVDSLQELTAAHIDAFHQELLWEPNSRGKLYTAHSVDQFLRRTRQVLRWAHRCGFIERDPCAHLLLPHHKAPARELFTWEELQTFLTSFDRTRPAGLRDAALFTLVMETPLGLLRCLELQLGQESLLELEPPTLELVAQYVREARPLMLKDPQEKTLIISRFGGPIGRTVAANMIRNAAKIAGLPLLTSRSLRRSYLAHLDRQAQSRHFSFNRNGL